MKSLLFYYRAVIVPASTLLPIVAGVINYKKIDKPLKTLLMYLIGALLINITAIYVGTILHKNNMPGLHLYTLFETVIVMWYYKQAFNDTRLDRWFYGIMIAFPVYCIINFTFFQSLYTYNTYTRPIGALLIILASVMYLSAQTNTNSGNNTTTPGSIVSAGFLIYFCSSILQFTFSNVVSHMASKVVKNWIWGIHATFVMIMYLFFFVAFLKNERNNR